MTTTKTFHDSHENAEISEENETFENSEYSEQQEFHHDGNKYDLTTSTTTVAEFSRRRNSLTPATLATSTALLPLKVLLDNTKDEKLLMRFVSIIAHCHFCNGKDETHFNDSISHFAG